MVCMAKKNAKTREKAYMDNIMSISLLKKSKSSYSRAIPQYPMTNHIFQLPPVTQKKQNTQLVKQQLVFSKKFMKKTRAYGNKDGSV